MLHACGPGVFLNPRIEEVEEAESHPKLPWQWKNLAVALGDRRAGARLQKPCGCRKMSAIPVISRSPAGGKQGEMPTASSHRSQGCYVPQDIPIPKPKKLSSIFCSQRGPRVIRRARSSTVSRCFFFPSLTVASLDVKIQAKIKYTLKKSPGGSGKQQLSSPFAALKGCYVSARRCREAAGGRRCFVPVIAPRAAKGFRLPSCRDLEGLLEKLRPRCLEPWGDVEPA